DLEYEERRVVHWEDVQRLEEKAAAWVDQVARAIVDTGYPIVGCTCMFQQINAAVAILNRVKELSPGTITLIGGANCEGEMAEGIASLGANIDYIFSGESDVTFPAFLRDVLAGRRPAERIIHGSPLVDMEPLPTPSYADYYEQLQTFLGGAVPPEDTWIMYETSRGCWWGEKEHCTFCGLNASGMEFRKKSPEKVLAELEGFAVYPTRNIMMTDNIMPHSYYKTLVPELGDRGMNLNLFYEQKANISLEKVIALKRAGIDWIQPGIEALSSSLLKRMRKGVSAHQNLALLRYGRAADVYLTWNLLWGFPGDQREDYEEVLAMAPLIHHLCPPNAVGQLSIERFSPYFFEPAAHGVANIRPLSGYEDVFPEGVQAARLAYHFVADYECGSYDHADVIRALKRDVTVWRKSWENGSEKPELRIVLHEGQYVLLDTRGLPGTEEFQMLDRSEAAFLMPARPYTGSDEEKSALERKLALVTSNWFVPLVVAEPEMMLELEQAWKTYKIPEASGATAAAAL
ncbi:MAG TPA: RiPP maturation radical SAM C-methyltransferase, partial [Thermoanaerobaculia bacterium]|nr:RiPP maturation radical SAM C-methyltransferase [Thermoanaerobaculia bacterium]